MDSCAVSRHWRRAHSGIRIASRRSHRCRMTHWSHVTGVTHRRASTPSRHCRRSLDRLPAGLFGAPDAVSARARIPIYVRNIVLFIVFLLVIFDSPQRPVIQDCYKTVINDRRSRTYARSCPSLSWQSPDAVKLTQCFVGGFCYKTAAQADLRKPSNTGFHRGLRG